MNMSPHSELALPPGKERDNSNRVFAKRARNSARESEPAVGHANATAVNCATASCKRSSVSSLASPSAATRPCALLRRTTDHFITSCCMGERPNSIRQRAIADCSTGTCPRSASSESTAARATPSAAKITSASAFNSLARAASVRCSDSCLSASSFWRSTASAASPCWWALERFNTVTATHAAAEAEITAAGMAPRAPAQSSTHSLRLMLANKTANHVATSGGTP